MVFCIEPMLRGGVNADRCGAKPMLRKEAMLVVGNDLTLLNLRNINSNFKAFRNCKGIIKTYI